jgi:chemotaxis family two-component system response regulator Rcp1
MGAHHILLVEDNPGDVRLIEESLRMHALDYKLIHYETADAAINALARCGTNGNGLPELILLDFNVPRGDARDILAAASRNPALAETPKAIVTSYLAPGDRAQALELGATCFIDKPPTLESFLSEVGGKIAELLRPSSRIKS